jgi:PhnB protein
MATVIPYLNFAGKTALAAEFYKTVFGGDAEVQKDGDRVVQLEFRAGDIHFMGADHDQASAGVGLASATSMVLTCDSEAQLAEWYDKLVAGGATIFAPMDSGWGAVIAHCTDQFGVSWMLNYDKPA